MKKDTLFTQEIAKKFEFDNAVAEVFDDMVIRSVPFYEEVIRLSAHFALEFAKPHGVILDLGSSTGELLLYIAKKADKPLSLIGLDSSQPMLQKAQQKFKTHNIPAEFICADILEYGFPTSDVMIANYTLQFVRPIFRGQLVEKIYKSLQKGGIFICSEKITHSNKILDFKITQSYFNYKKQQGYSNLEIAQKRDALENVLVPYSDQENREMFLQAGFKDIMVLFCWVNFITYLMIK